jgi:DNA-binding transcriptional LysR family regulator
MDRVTAMRMFVAVADRGGFAAAARGLRVSAPTVTRAIAALERRIGAPLLTRTTRVVRLTEAGAGYAADCRRLLVELEDAERAASGGHGEARGEVVLTAPVMFGRIHVTPVLVAFLAAYPAISVRAVFTDRVVDLGDEGIHAAVRIAELDPASWLHARQVGVVRRVLCASPAFLRRHGTPRTIDDVERIPAVAFASDAVAPVSYRVVVDGAPRVVRPPVRLVVNSSDAALEAALAGHGTLVALSYQVARPLRAGRLRRILRELEPPPIPVHVVHRDGRRAPARVRALVDFLAPRIARRLAEHD